MKEHTIIKQTFSITLPILLYEQLLQEVGRRNVSRFVKKVVEKELKKTDKKSLREAYQMLESCQDYQTEAEEWEQSDLESDEKEY